MAEPRVSVVVPVFNERQNLPKLHERLSAALEATGRSWEIVYTDDGSKDGSIDLLKDFHAADPGRVRVIEFERNAGQHMAIMAAFERARGEVVVTIDADLQNPPEEIGKLLALADKGHDVVGSIRKDRQDVGWRVWASRAMNWERERITRDLVTRLDAA
ncbi:MAG: glycosyltransferase family 2 protein, partial [Tagaea sp.]